ncbi:IS200/IS605 family transposase [Cytophaga aurantiaca]|uniref:IS200/IS605 family transposase n=1 Tax=Cytophaga aurantiaca TaxID=29530 RepID=UPI000373081F|nr:IS200/IS605 family transposase [Cytophaga aurantiaca]
MPNTFSQIYIQVVFAVKGRECQVQHSWEEKLYKYIAGVVQNHKLIAINGMPDHIHFLIGMKPTCCLSDLIREIKKASNAYIKDNKLSPYKFQWQEGFGAFSYSHSSLDNVIHYIMNQKQHHTNKTFKQEYEEFLTKFNIEFKSEYLFEWYE